MNIIMNTIMNIIMNFIKYIILIIYNYLNNSNISKCKYPYLIVNNYDDLCDETDIFGIPYKSKIIRNRLVGIDIGILEYQSLEYLHIDLNLYCNEDQKIEFNHSLNKLPTTLKSLLIKARFNMPLDNLPNGLRYLYINSQIFNQSLDYLPYQLSTLIIYNGYFKETLHKLTNLPNMCTKVIIGNNTAWKILVFENICCFG